MYNGHTFVVFLFNKLLRLPVYCVQYQLIYKTHFEVFKAWLKYLFYKLDFIFKCQYIIALLMKM
jgi:hypothetical protein